MLRKFNFDSTSKIAFMDKKEEIYDYFPNLSKEEIIDEENTEIINNRKKPLLLFIKLEIFFEISKKKKVL